MIASRSYATIDLEALRHNDALISRRVGKGRSVIAMLKANAYGHGLLTVSHALRDRRDCFAVATLEAAIALRQINPTASILVMSGHSEAQEIEEFIHHRLTSVIHHRAQVEFLSQQKAVPPGLSVWIKIDLGMHRLGFMPHQFAAIYDALCALQKTGHVSCDAIGMLGHLPNACDEDRTETRRLLSYFRELTTPYPGPKSAGHSPVILEYPEDLVGYARPGGMLFGLSLFPNTTGADYGLKPVMTLHSRLLEVREVKRGERVGYGGKYQCEEDMRIGVVAIGYGDGYPQQADHRVSVLIRGQRCPLAGSVSMDYLTVDLRSCPEATVGDDVILWGSAELPIEEVASPLGLPPYALTSMLNERVKRETCHVRKEEKGDCVAVSARHAGT